VYWVRFIKNPQIAFVFEESITCCIAKLCGCHVTTMWIFLEEYGGAASTHRDL